jgi:hypothetical protein
MLPSSLITVSLVVTSLSVYFGKFLLNRFKAEDEVTMLLRTVVKTAYCPQVENYKKVINNTYIKGGRLRWSSG